MLEAPRRRCSRISLSVIRRFDAVRSATLTLAMLAAACLAGQTLPVAASPSPRLGICSSSAPIITPGTGIGPLALGMPATTVTSLLGLPDTVSITGHLPSRPAPPSSIERTLIFADPNDGLSVEIFANAVVMITLTDTPEAEPCHTAGGLHVGDPAASLLSAYGPPDLARSAQNLRIAKWVYNARGLVVETLDGRITLIGVFVPGQYCIITRDADVGCR